MSRDNETGRAITPDGIRVWLPWFLGVGGIVITASGSYFGARAELAILRDKVAVIEAKGTEPTRLLAVRVERLETTSAAETRSREELLGRMRNVERLLAQLVCRQEGAATAACERAMSAIGP